MKEMFGGRSKMNVVTEGAKQQEDGRCRNSAALAISALALT